MAGEGTGHSVERLYRHRRDASWGARLRRWMEPPMPYVRNPDEPSHFPLGKHNLYIGGAGTHVAGYINLDIAPMPGVDLLADAQHLPFPDGIFQRIECDAVLEHVPDAGRVMREMERVLATGGYLHVVTPFCHPFHEYPKDYRRFTPDGLKEMRGGMEVVAEGWRTGPAATFLVFTLEFVKLWLPFRAWRLVAHGFLGWVLFPLRYLDLLFFKSPNAARLGNHCYVWFWKQ